MLLVLLAESELLKLFDLFASLFNRLIVNGLLLEIATAYVFGAIPCIMGLGGRGGTGRRTGLKILSQQWREGSTPSVRTTRRYCPGAGYSRCAG
jgi:hypothetical protein